MRVNSYEKALDALRAAASVLAIQGSYISTDQARIQVALEKVRDVLTEHDLSQAGNDRSPATPSYTGEKNG